MAELNPGEFLIVPEKPYTSVGGSASVLTRYCQPPRIAGVMRRLVTGPDLVLTDGGTYRADTGELLGPATSADLLDLDAVPDPVDSDAPREVHLPGAAPIGPSAETRPYRTRKR